MSGRPISFDRVADIYDATRKLPPEIMERVVERLAALLSEHHCNRILDAGVGTGRYALPLQERGLCVIGIDIAEKMLDQARGKGLVNLLRGDIRRLPFRSKCFDAALSIHVLHLVRDWRQALFELRRVVRKELVSVVSIFPEQSDSLIDIYEKMLMDSGWKEIHPGMRERELPNLVAPSYREYVASVEEERHAKDIIDLLEKRVYSSLWEVPEELHRRIISRLREDYGQGNRKSRRDLYIYAWDVQESLQKMNVGAVQTSR